jgi:hypothetical protein
MNTRNHKYISIDHIIARLMRHPMLKDVNYDDMIAHAVDVLRLLKVPGQHEEKSCFKDIVEYKVRIPEESLNVKAVDLIKNKNHIPMVMATDTAHNHLNNLNKNRNNTTENTYSINGGMINTNQREGEVFIIYDAFKTDELGLPMIPDSIAVIKAIENYIKVQVFGVLVDLQKVSPNTLSRAEQEYGWYMGKAQSEFQGFVNEDDTESFLRNFKRLFINNNSHKDRGRYGVNRELKLPN